MTSILVTGGAGFVGANLVRSLLGDGARLRVLDDLSSGRSEYFNGLVDDVEVRWKSIADRDAVESAARGMDAIVHLAAMSGVQPSVDRPDRDFEINVRGTFNVLDAARVAGVRSVVFASSGAVSAASTPPLHERLLPAPLAPYGASKFYGEVALEAFARSYGFVGTSLRFSNMYGPYCSHKRSVIATFLRAAQADGHLQINGDGNQTRDFLYVSDVATATARALAGTSGGTYQLGTGMETSVLQLAREVADVTGLPLELLHGPALRADASRNYADTTKARTELGWQATVALRTGLASTWSWLCDYEGLASGSRNEGTG